MKNDRNRPYNNHQENNNRNMETNTIKHCECCTGRNIAIKIIDWTLLITMIALIIIAWYHGQFIAKVVETVPYCSTP